MDALNLLEIRRLPELEWCIDGLLPKRGVMVIGGPPKLGKSRVVLDMATRMVEQRPLWHPDLQPRCADNVLLFCAEGGPPLLRLRSGIYSHLGEFHMAMISATGKHPSMSVDRGLNHLQIEEYAAWCRPYDVAVFDPMVSFHGLNENDNQQMGAMMDAFRHIAEKGDCSVILVHHEGKPGERSLFSAVNGMRLRGASAIFGACDAAAMLTRNADDEVKWHFDVRYAKEPESFTMVADKVSGRFYRQLEFEPGVMIPDVEDFARDFGTDIKRFRVGFDVPMHIAIKALEEVKKHAKTKRA